MLSRAALLATNNGSAPAVAGDSAAIARAVWRNDLHLAWVLQAIASFAAQFRICSQSRVFIVDPERFQHIYSHCKLLAMDGVDD